MDKLKQHLACTNWSRLPAPVWYLVASPILYWCLGGPKVFTWPHGCSKSPLRASFWCVSKGAR